MAETRPQISEKLLDAFEAWIAFLNSGPSPAPRRYTLASIERNCSSGQGGDSRRPMDDPSEIAKGVRVDDAFRKLIKTQRECINVHIRWSAYNPIDGMSIAWPDIRKHEASQAKMSEANYEATLIAGLAYLEYFICV